MIIINYNRISAVATGVEKLKHIACKSYEGGLKMPKYILNVESVVPYNAPEAVANPKLSEHIPTKMSRIYEKLYLPMRSLTAVVPVAEGVTIPQNGQNSESTANGFKHD